MGFISFGGGYICGFGGAEGSLDRPSPYLPTSLSPIALYHAPSHRPSLPPPLPLCAGPARYVRYDRRPTAGRDYLAERPPQNDAARPLEASCVGRINARDVMTASVARAASTTSVARAASETIAWVQAWSLLMTLLLYCTLSSGFQ